MAIEQRPFGVWTASALVVGSMVGAGIFVLPGQLAPFGWTGAAAWIVVGLGAMTIARLIAGLTALMPDEPGILAICGKAMGPLPGVSVGWSYWTSIWCGNAAVATTAARYLSSFYPPIGATPLRTALVGVAILVSLTLLNLRGARAAGRFQVVTTVLKLLPLVAVVVIIAALVAMGGEQFTATPHAAFNSSELTTTMTLAFFAVLGFETASLVTERVRDPARNVVRATLIGLALTGLLYLVVCTGIVLAMPAEVLQAAPAPVAYFVEHFWGRSAGLAVAAFTVISGIGYLNGSIFVQGELPLTMVRSGELPGWMARTNRRDVAVAPLVVASSLSCFLMVGSATTAGAELLNFLLLLTTASMIWFYLAVCISALCLRRHYALAVIGILFLIWVLYGTGWKAGGLGVCLMLLSLPLYYFTRSGVRTAAASG